MANFLNKPLADELIYRIAEQCTFKRMKENENSYKPWDDVQSSPLLRRGVAEVGRVTSLQN